MRLTLQRELVFYDCTLWLTWGQQCVLVSMSFFVVVLIMQFFFECKQRKPNALGSLTVTNQAQWILIYFIFKCEGVDHWSVMVSGWAPVFSSWPVVCHTSAVERLQPSRQSAYKYPNLLHPHICFGAIFISNLSVLFEMPAAVFCWIYPCDLLWTIDERNPEHVFVCAFLPDSWCVVFWCSISPLTLMGKAGNGKWKTTRTTLFIRVVGDLLPQRSVSQSVRFLGVLHRIETDTGIGKVNWLLFWSMYRLHPPSV